MKLLTQQLTKLKLTADRQRAAPKENDDTHTYSIYSIVWLVTSDLQWGKDTLYIVIVHLIVSYVPFYVLVF